MSGRQARNGCRSGSSAAALVVITIIPGGARAAGSARSSTAVPLVPPLKVLFCLALVCLYAAIVVAILKYRLYEIDIVISKAVQYGTLAVFISAVYAGLVAGIGTLAGDRRSPLLSAIAAVVVALAFHPVQQRAAGLANWLVTAGGPVPTRCYPSSPDVSAAATHATCWLRWPPSSLPEPEPCGWSCGCASAELRAEAASDGSTAESVLVDGHQLPELPDTDFDAPVLYQGELLGAISVRMPRDEPLNPAAEQRAADVASQAWRCPTPADRGPPCIAAAPGIGSGRGAAPARTQPARRRATGPGRPGNQTPPGRPGRGGGHRGSQAASRRAARGRCGCAEQPPRSGQRNLPAAARGPRAGRGAASTGRQVACPGAA